MTIFARKPSYRWQNRRMLPQASRGLSKNSKATICM